MPQQPLPAATDILPQLIRITPSLSSACDEDEERPIDEEEVHYHRSRTELSPSPEVDLSSPELEVDNTREPASPARNFATGTTQSQERTQSPKDLLHNRRAMSPQLEPEEKTFKQTANQMYQQAQARQNSLREVDMTLDVEPEQNVVISIESEENMALKNSAAAAELFQQEDHLRMPASAMVFSSPIMQPQTTTIESSLQSSRRDEVMEHMSLDLGPKEELMESIAWDTLQSPENIELAELDDMFDAY